MRGSHKKIIYALFFLILEVSSFGVEPYISNNLDEKLYLQKIREDELILGIPEDGIIEACEHQKGLSEIILELFQDYLQLKVKVKKGPWDDVYDDFKDGKTDAIALITRKVERQSFTEFSKKLFGENLYLTSRKTKINSLEDINDETIYYYKSDSNLKTLTSFLEKENIKANLVAVENILDYRDKIIYVSGLYANGFPYRIEVGHLPYSSIGVSKKYAPLIPIINHALALKYEEEIKNSLIHKKIKVQTENFKENLTEIEKKYLKDITEQGIALEPNSAVSRYSKRRGEFIGIVPEVLKRSAILMDVPYYHKGNEKERLWSDKIEVFPAFSPKENYEILSDSIYDLEIFLIYNKNNINEYIGIIKNSIYEEVGKNFIFPEQIKFYSSHNEQEKAFEEGLINGIITAYPDKYNPLEYEIDRIGIKPLFLAFQKKDEKFKNIFNKALKALGKEEIKKIILNVYRDENQEIIWEKEHAEKMMQIFIGMGFFAIVAIAGLGYWGLYERKLSQSLRSDFLTGLPNRVVFNEFCAYNEDKKGIAILIDIDNFKEINERFNYKCGDSILIEVARILKKIFEENSVFRISGDEFYCFLEKIDWERRIEILESHVKDSAFLQNYNISFSLGYYHKKENETLEDAFRYASMAMLVAKLEKDTTIVEATPNLIKDKSRELKIKEILNERIESEFYPVFQPKYRVFPQQEIVGAEVLCRWKNAELGMISPSEFIPLSEKIKCVYLIDFKIAEVALKSLKNWLDDGIITSKFRLSFNISLQSFDREDFVDKIEFLLKKYDIPAKYLEIEITETTFSTNMSQTLRKLLKLKKLGISIALDDFTAGHSTTSLLSFLPIDILKFDSSLITLYRKDKEKGAIIYKTLLKMAQDLNLETVAEGVEEKDEYDFLKEEKIDVIQGYYLGKPMEKKEFETLLKEI